MYFVLLCECVFTTVYTVCVTAGLHVCDLTPMVREERKRQKENRTKRSVECAWFWDYIGPCAWENTKRSVCSQTDERLGKCLALAPSDFNSDFKLSLTFKAVLKAVVQSLILSVIQNGV